MINILKKFYLGYCVQACFKHVFLYPVFISELPAVFWHFTFETERFVRFVDIHTSMIQANHSCQQKFIRLLGC